jgi:hypothetical protein
MSFSTQQGLFQDRKTTKQKKKSECEQECA